MHQIEFNLAPAPPVGELETLLAWLAANPGFHTAKTISSQLPLTDRQIRQLAELSDGLIISGPGSPGYCHLNHCDPATISHIADTLKSQAKRMFARSIKIRRRAVAAITGRPITQ
jgi:hypothetical protein